MNEIEFVCNGVFGCNQPPLWWFVLALGLLLVVMALLTIRIRVGSFETDGG